MKRNPLWLFAVAVAVGLFARPSVMKAAGPPVGFTDQALVGGLTSATAIAAAPDGRLFVCEQGGRLRVINGGVLLPTPFLTLPVDSSGERGLLGVALHPGFATNNKVYVYRTVPGNPAHNRVSEYLADGNVAVGGSATPTEVAHFDIDNLTAATNHNGGALHFGRNAPGDFKLIVAVGDNATGLAAADPATSPPQRTDNLLGKILRLNDDLTIPGDNPFFGSTTGNNRAILVIGLRNPFTFGMAKEGVDVAPPHIFINDVGQDTWEEIDEGLPGANYGWPVVEGPAPAAVPGMTYPIFSYNHTTGNPIGATVIGGAFVDPALGRFPASMAGDYFFGDHATNFIKTLHEPTPGTFQVQDFDDGNGPVGFAFGKDGRLYYTVFSGVRVVDYPLSGAPDITEQPQDVQALAGTGAVISVAASGSGLSYQWFKNGVSIPGANADTYLLPDTGGSGRYHCLVTNASGRDLSRVATVTIDTAATFRFSAANYAVSEAAASALITVTRVGTAAGATVHYATSDGTATAAGLDYTQTSGTLTFGATQKALRFSVPILKDTAHEGSERVLLSLDTPEPAAQGAALGAPSTAVLTITDNDMGGKVQFGAVAYSVNAAAAAGTVKLTLRRIGGLASGVTVHCTMAGGTAIGGTDYDDTPQDVTFLSSGLGAMTQTLSIPVSKNLTEAKTFKVNLDPPSGGAILGTPTVSTVTILGAQPTLSFSSAAYNVKTTQARALITVRRSAPLMGTVRVHYATSADTATPGGDYTEASGDLAFGPNVSVRMFSVPVVKDPLVDTPKTVNLTLSNPTWTGGTATVDGAFGTSVLTIQNPNLPPSVQFSAATYTVNEAMPKATITVRRTGDLAGTVTVPYHVTGGTASGSGVDYTLDPGILTFGPNQTMRTFPISVVNDTDDEGTETVDLALDPPTWSGGAAVIGANGSATLDITDNESTVQFGAAAYSASEAAKSMIVTVRRRGPLTADATVTYDVTGGTAVRDTGSGGDYSVVAPGVLTFAPGQSVKTLPITLNPDTVVDGAKTIDLALTALTGAEVGTPGSTLVTIKDNDLAGVVRFSASDYSTSEGGGTATITVSRAGGTSSEATIDYTTADGSAQDGVDYTLTAGTLTFGLGEKSKTFAVPILDDAVANPGVKSLILTLSDPANGLALATPSTATLWIVKE